MDDLLYVSREISLTLSDPRLSSRYLDLFKSSTSPSQVPLDGTHPAPVACVVEALKALRLSLVAKIFHVPSDYYAWPLPRRALAMAVPSIHHLCKSVVMENKRWRGSAELDPANARFYCVVVQYSHSISSPMLIDAVREAAGGRVARKHYNFRLAAPDVSLRLTGFANNGVCPFGMPADVPVILAESIVRLMPRVLWLGCGHPDYKLALPVESFVAATRCMVADVSVPVSDKQ